MLSSVEYGVVLPAPSGVSLNCGNAHFNGDLIPCKEFMRLKTKYDITAVVETGTYLGMTTSWFARNFSRVETLELSPEFWASAVEKFKEFPHVHCHKGSSDEVLAKLLPSLSDERVIFYLDAHWGADNPIHRELEVIAKTFQDWAIIVVDDFYTPGRHYGFDFCDPGHVPLCYEYIKEKLALVYPSGYHHYYLDRSEQPTGGTSGKIYIIPKAFNDGSLSREISGVNYSNL